MNTHEMIELVLAGYDPANVVDEGIRTHFKRHWKKYAVGAGVVGAAALGHKLLKQKPDPGPSRTPSGKLRLTKEQRKKDGDFWHALGQTKKKTREHTRWFNREVEAGNIPGKKISI